MKQSQYAVKDSKEGKLDLILLWRVFAGHFWKILLVGILMAGLLGSLRYLTTSVRYATNVKFLINGMTLTKIGDEYTYIANGSSASVIGSQFAMNAPSIIGGDNTLEKVCDYLTENKGYKADFISPRTVKGMLSVSYDEQIVVVTITGPNSTLTHDVAEAFRYMIPGQMDYFYGIENKYNTAETTENGEQDEHNSQYENVKSVAKALNSVPSAQDIESSGKLDRGTVTYAVIGFMLGAIAIYVICFLRAYFDNTVYGEDDLKTNFVLPVVGQIPDWDNATGNQGSSSKKKAKKTSGSARSRDDIISDRDYSGRLLSDHTPFAITEAFKSLRTNMCYTTKGERCAVYGITSAYVQAGKSLVIANLAVSFSMMNKKVLLLDGDLRCPVQHKIFNISNRVHGFSDVLAGICRYEDIELRDGGYPNLSILTCGKLPPNPAELLASENMTKFIERARQDYDFIFIDLPPVSEVSDAGIISELVTGFAFVVRAGYSDRRMVELALESMEGFEAPMTGFILNDIDIKSGKYYKNKYYTYGGKYGKYGKYAKYGRYGGNYGAYGTAYTREGIDEN